MTTVAWGHVYDVSGMPNYSQLGLGLVLDLGHLPVSYQDIKWKQSIASHISAVMMTHRAAVHQKFSRESA